MVVIIASQPTRLGDNNELVVVRRTYTSYSLESYLRLKPTACSLDPQISQEEWLMPSVSLALLPSAYTVPRKWLRMIACARIKQSRVCCPFRKKD